jgi:hypothetical protein
MLSLCSTPELSYIPSPTCNKNTQTSRENDSVVLNAFNALPQSLHNHTLRWVLLGSKTTPNMTLRDQNTPLVFGMLIIFSW